MKKLLFLTLITLMLTSCEGFWKQATTKHFGNDMTVKLNPNEKLVEVTWKDDNIWYLTEPMDSNYVPKTKVFREISIYGVFQGSITFVETK